LLAQKRWCRYIDRTSSGRVEVGNRKNGLNTKFGRGILSMLLKKLGSKEGELLS